MAVTMLAIWLTLCLAVLWTAVVECPDQTVRRASYPALVTIFCTNLYVMLSLFGT